MKGILKDFIHTYLLVGEDFGSCRGRGGDSGTGTGTDTDSGCRECLGGEGELRVCSKVDVSSESSEDSPREC